MLDMSRPVIFAEPVATPSIAIVPAPAEVIINDAHAAIREGGKMMLQKAKEAGEALLQKKQELPHGAFKRWVEANCRCSYVQATKYMNVARRSKGFVDETFDGSIDAFLGYAKAKTPEAPVPDAASLATGPAETPAKTPRAPVAPTGADDAAEVASLRAELHRVREEAAEAEKFFDEREARLMAEIAELREALKGARREIKRLQAIIEASPVARVAAMKGTTPIDAGMVNNWDF